MKCYLELLVLLLVQAVASESDVIVEIQQGFLKGKTLLSTRSNKTFFAFKGIPYAKPPTGSLRFKAPVQPESWNGTRDAQVEGSVCPQKNVYTNVYEGGEDCLFLNVYTPQLSSGSGELLKAVMVWIHGGGWHFGSSNQQENGPDYFMEEDIVLVVMNYRLGALGFLSLPNEETPGNNGLKDQVMALHWVQQNIRHFGGDPGKVTIFGVSAGGASVHYHLMSPMSHGLFHRVILQSGVALNPWAFNEPDTNHNYTYSLGRLLGYNKTDPQELLHLLLQETPERIVEFTFNLQPDNGIPFHPTTDMTAAAGNVFLPDTVQNLVRSGRFQKVPFIAGVNSREGLWELPSIRKSVSENTVQLEDLPKELHIIMDETRTREIASEIENLYFGNESFAGQSLNQHIDLSGDLSIVIGSYLAARQQALFSSEPVYFYEFSYSGGMSIFKNYIGGDEFEGSCHLDDSAYLFHMARINETYDINSSEVLTSRRMIRLWTNFAKHGNPTIDPEPILQNTIWSPVTNSDFSYLNINSNLTMRHHFRREKMNFWEALLQYNATSI